MAAAVRGTARPEAGVRLGAARREVGRDLAGNVYYVSTDGRDRRGVEYAPGVLRLDRVDQVHTVPVQWRGWLSRGRDDPPSAEELLAFQRDQVALRERVRELDEADRADRESQRARRLAAVQAATSDLAAPPPGPSLPGGRPSATRGDPNASIRTPGYEADAADALTADMLDEVDEFDPSAK